MISYDEHLAVSVTRILQVKKSTDFHTIILLVMQ